MVSMIWGSSFVFVKIGLKDIAPLTLAGLRYFGAFLVLLPFVFHRFKDSSGISFHLWIRLILMGLSAYTIGNGAFFLALQYLPATTSSFLMSFTPVLVIIAGIFWLKEIPTRWQVFGVIISMVGSLLFFSSGLKAGEPLGILFVLVGLVGFTVFGILGRSVARERKVDTLSLTAIPLAIGGGLLLVIALPIEGLPVFTPSAWFIVLWLAVVNTAFAYILYNHSLRTLSALEMNVMLNLTPLGTAILAWFFLDERLSVIQIVGMITVIIGVILVQQVNRRIVIEPEL